MNAERVSPARGGRTLEQALSRLAREPHLLVACDYDGTLAPIVDVPGDARPRRESVAALRALAALPDTSVAVISGRSLHDLAALSRLPEEIHLVGSHGTEFDVGFASALPPDALALRDRITDDMHAIAATRTGVLVEHKPAGVALHYRQASEEDGRSALAAVREGPARLPGVHAREGKQVIELAVVQADKGFALDAIRHQVGATAAVFVGDDVTDEDAFSRLTGPDLGIKVGPGPTFAELRVADPEDVARLLARLVETRREWLAGANAVPIARHAMLADGKTVALVTPDARITWLCHPRPDSAPIFAELVGGHTAGALAVRPGHDGLPTAQRYHEGTLTLETRWAGLTVHDYLDRGEPYGRVRLVRVLEGTAEAVVEFTPRPDFGRQQISLRADPNGVVVVGAADPVALFAPGLAWEIDEVGGHPTARARIDTRVSGPYVIELRCGSWSLTPHPTPEPERRERTETTWRNWAAGLRLPALARQQVERSALTLRGLCHEQSGAILAAATTSLPEEIGGVRNWDYRYCWLRDAALTALALVELGSNSEADVLLGYIERLAKAEQGAERLRPLYSVLGGDAGTEAVIEAMPGYAGSRPVRVGNAAAQQVQLDVFGPVVELAYAVAVAGGRLSEAHHVLVEQIVDAVARRWQEPDHGIWEVRRQPRHHVHSRTMCWLAVDRAIRLARLTGRPAHDSWQVLADRIAADVLQHGWKEEVRSFTAAYDGVDLDAAALQIGLCGLLRADDERFAATVEAVELRLREGPTVYRYRSDDGLPGSEGGFHLCALWLAEAYALVGRQSDAQALFDQILELAGPTGLLSEQYDPHAERSLGNHPQAYSHLALIRVALVLDRLPGMTVDYEDAVAVGGLSVRLLRPSEPEELFAVAAEARGDAPYWAELWPCARALAAHLATMDLTGLRVVELGCGLALPSLVAALRGADVVASDYSADALERVAESGRRTLGRPLETLRADLHAPAPLIERGPFDLVLGADLLYDCTLAEAMGALIPQIAPAALFAYAWKRSAIPLASPLVAHGYRIAQWRPGAKGPRLFEALREG